MPPLFKPYHERAFERTQEQCKQRKKSASGVQWECNMRGNSEQNQPQCVISQPQTTASACTSACW